MDTQSLATELAPVIVWQKERRPEFYRQYWSNPPKGSSDKSFNQPPAYGAWYMLYEEGEDIDASSPIPLDDGMLIDFGAIEVVNAS